MALVYDVQPGYFTAGKLLGVGVSVSVAAGVKVWLGDGVVVFDAVGVEDNCEEITLPVVAVCITVGVVVLYLVNGVQAVSNATKPQKLNLRDLRMIDSSIAIFPRPFLALIDHYLKDQSQAR